MAGRPLAVRPDRQRFAQFRSRPDRDDARHAASGPPDAASGRLHPGAAPASAARDAGLVDAISLAALASAQGGLERIKNTPLPKQYSQFPRIFVRVFCLLLPLGLVHDLGYLTPLGSALVGFMFLALDQVGIDLEDPFEGKLHDVPMQAITRAIELNLHQMIGHRSNPPAVEMKDGVLN